MYPNSSHPQLSWLDYGRVGRSWKLPWQLQPLVGARDWEGLCLHPRYNSTNLPVMRNNKRFESPCRWVKNWKWTVKTWWIFDVDLKISADKEGPGPAAVRLFWMSNFQAFQQLSATMATFSVSAETKRIFFASEMYHFFSFLTVFLLFLGFSGSDCFFSSVWKLPPIIF